jgi:hypothetical protein
MQPIRIISRKYDGRLRDEYEALLYPEDHERLVVYAPVGTMSFNRHKQACVPARMACWRSTLKIAGITSGTSASRPAPATRCIATFRCQHSGPPGALSRLISTWITRYISPELLAIAPTQIAAADIDQQMEAIVEADACDLSRWPDASFDAVVCLGRFYHLPDPAEECISYQLPPFRYNRMLVGLGATANHCAFYSLSEKLWRQRALE